RSRKNAARHPDLAQAPMGRASAYRPDELLGAAPAPPAASRAAHPALHGLWVADLHVREDQEARTKALLHGVALSYGHLFLLLSCCKQQTENVRSCIIRVTTACFLPAPRQARDEQQHAPCRSSVCRFSARSAQNGTQLKRNVRLCRRLNAPTA